MRADGPSSPVRSSITYSCYTPASELEMHQIAIREASRWLVAAASPTEVANELRRFAAELERSPDPYNSSQWPLPRAGLRWEFGRFRWFVRDVQNEKDLALTLFLNDEGAIRGELRKDPDANAIATAILLREGARRAFLRPSSREPWWIRVRRWLCR